MRLNGMKKNNSKTEVGINPMIYCPMSSVCTANIIFNRIRIHTQSVFDDKHNAISKFNVSTH